MYYYFINVRVAQNVWAIVTDSAERRMPFADRVAAQAFAERMGIKDYSIEQSLYQQGFAGYQ